MVRPWFGKTGRSARLGGDAFNFTGPPRAASVFRIREICFLTVQSGRCHQLAGLLPFIAAAARAIHIP